MIETLRPFGVLTKYESIIDERAPQSANSAVERARHTPRANGSVLAVRRLPRDEVALAVGIRRGLVRDVVRSERARVCGELHRDAGWIGEVHRANPRLVGDA